MGSEYFGFPYSVTGQDPLALANEQFIQHCQQQAALQNVASAQNLSNGLNAQAHLKPVYGRCAYCASLFHEQAHECASCGAPR